MFSLMDSLICEYTDATVYQYRVLKLLKLLVETKHWECWLDEHAGLVAELLGSFGRLSDHEQ